MNERFNNPEEVSTFLNSSEFVDGLKKYLISLVQAIPPDIAGPILKAFTASPEDLQALWKTLAGHGWFPHPSMFFGAELLVNRISGDSDAVEQLLIDLFRDELPSIESELVDLYPNRRHLLSKGFEAHRQGQYCLSILMFLAQADGIAYDKYSEGVFSERERKTLGSEETHEQPGEILASFLGLFGDDYLPIWVSGRKRDSSFRGFNRHMVMHGESVDYDTEENSLKAVSFLSWLAVVLNHGSDSGQNCGVDTLP